MDFAIEEDRNLTHLIEVKSSDDNFNGSLNYFSLSLKPKLCLQIVRHLKRTKDFKSHQVLKLTDFLASLET